MKVTFTLKTCCLECFEQLLLINYSDSLILYAIHNCIIDIEIIELTDVEPTQKFCSIVNLSSHRQICYL